MHFRDDHTVSRNDFYKMNHHKTSPAIRVLALCLLLFAFALDSYAQPPNNNWANAITVPIGPDNFSTGIFQGTMVNMTGAGNQPGEYLQNPTYNKTAWYKFSIPTHRVVRIKVLQPTEVLQSTDAGFFVYNSTPGIPAVTDLATFTPMFSFASYSENVCLDPGEYYIQLIAKNAANSDVYVEINIDYTYPTSTSQANDQAGTGMNLGTLGNTAYNYFSWDCLSLETKEEYVSGLGADSVNFTKSIWYTFTTDSHIDLLSYYVSSPNWTFNNLPVSLRIWEGNVDVNALDTSAVIYSTINQLYSTFTSVPCLLLPNTTYTVQIVGRKDYSGTSLFYLQHLGEGETTGAYPQVAFNPLNEFGSIVATPTPGTAVTRTDYFSCDAQLSDDSIQCGVVNPPDFVTANSTNYDLTTWFTFSTTGAGNALVRASVFSSFCNYNVFDHYMYIRIFMQTPDNDCNNFTLPGSLYFEGTFSVNGAIILNCLPAGDYSIQLLGRSGMGNPYSCTGSQFGRRIDLTVTLSGVPATEYGLQTAGDVDWINGGLPLQDNITYIADSASFSCEKTVVPDTAICAVVDRAMYRELIIGDADNDAIPDSGMVLIENYNFYDAVSDQAVKSVFYAGDASALAAAQSSYTWPGEITGLDPYEGCNMYNAFISPWWPYNIPYNLQKFCVTPGTYTLANVGDSTENGAVMAPKFTFHKNTTRFWNPANPDTLGDIIAQGMTVISEVDTFSCRENPDTIAGLLPCSGYTKLLYREFYLSEECRLTVTEQGNTSYPYNQFRVFSGRVSDVGIDGLSIAPYHAGGCYNSGYYGYSLPNCATVPAGWYTVVSYGYGPGYDNNYDFHEASVYPNWYYNTWPSLYSIDYTSTITVVADTTVPPGPFFNRPFKACVANNDLPLTWVNTGTTESPSGFTDYTLCMERFKPLQDTPFVNIPIVGCSGTERLSFYVFTTDQEYFVRITGVQSYYTQIYPLDVRSDSLLLPTTLPITSCTNQGNVMEICRLQPGTYTLVVFGTPSQNCETFTPIISVEPVDVSRFDRAMNAYDFGLIPGDGNYYNGKIGDLHPVYPGVLAPSNDNFYCTTGSSPSDPPTSCSDTYYDGIYPDTLNHPYYQEPGTQNGYKERNLWYTFVAQGMGTATVKIHNLTTPQVLPFKMYVSDVDANIPFEDLYAAGQLDSTLLDGLTYVHTNVYYWCYTSEESSYTFIDDICEVDTMKRRYYIIADIHEYMGGLPNIQMDLEIKWSPINSNPIDPHYDFYSSANWIGNNESDPPYTDVPLDYNTDYVGGWGNMSCATNDAADVALNDWYCSTAGYQRTLWYKVHIDQPGFLRIALESDDQPYYVFNQRLLSVINPGDSIIGTDLQNLGAGQNVYVAGSPYTWYRWCLEPGEYYFHVQHCAPLDTSNVRPHVFLEPISGDHCDQAISTTAPTFGVYTASIPILCHTMGGDFGEDGSNMACLQGPDDYVSTWFQFSYTGTDLADILFQLNLSGLYYYNGPANVRYRLFYGNDCSTMIAGQECATNAYINNSIACVSVDEGSFYVQVVYPQGTQGTLGFTYTVSENTNPDCNPFNPSLMVSDFFFQPNCAGDSTLFTNYATSGGSIEYIWDFGDGSPATSITNPVHHYPGPGDYDVMLYVINPITADTVTSVQTITITPTGSPLELGDDITICDGESATIGQVITFATYTWSTGESAQEIQVTDEGIYWLNILVGDCNYSDTIEVSLIDLSFDLGANQSICAGEILELDPVINEDVEYDWSTNATSDSILVSAAGLYYLDISIGDCVQSDSIEIEVVDLSFDLGNDTTLCAGSSWMLEPTVAAGVSYDWSDNTSGTSILIDAAGTYDLSINALGCSAADTIFVSMLDLSFSLGNDTIYCHNSSIVLSPAVTSGVSFLWNDNTDNTTLTVSSEGTYSLQISKLGCLASDSVNVEELDLTFTLGNDTTICEGANLTLLPVVPAGVTFDWSTFQVSSSIIVQDENDYSLTISSQTCEATDAIHVDVLDLAFELGPDITICDGDNFTIEPIVLTGVSHIWNGSIDALNLTVDTAGNYSLTIDSIGCSAYDDVDVSIFYVDAIVPEDLSTCNGDTALLIVNDVDFVIWSNTAFVMDYSATSYGLFPNVSTTFNWTAHENGCEQSGDIEVTVIEPYIPTVAFDDLYCNNENEISLPPIPFTTGSFYFESQLINVLPIPGLGSGSHDIEYIYTDTSGCDAAITLEFTVVDTTALSFDPAIPELCIDAAPLVLSTIVNIQGGIFSVSYEPGSLPNMITDNFDPAEIELPFSDPQAFALQYEFVNDDNCTSRKTSEIHIDPLPFIDVLVDPVCIADEWIAANYSGVNGSSISSVQWIIEDQGTFSDNTPPPLSFATPGTYDYSIVVTSGSGCVAGDSGTFIIYPQPETSFDWLGMCANDTAYFSGTGTIESGSIVNYTWLFGDGGTADGASAAHNFGGSGPYDVTFIAESDFGCRDTSVASVGLSPSPVGGMDPESGCIGQPSHITSTATIASGSIIAYEWMIEDDPGSEIQPEFTYTFASTGVYTITQQLLSDEGCTTSYTDSVTIYGIPVPAYGVSDRDLCQFDEVYFTDSSTVEAPSNIGIIEWTFSNGTSLVGDSVIYIASQSGVIDMTMVATSVEGCSDTIAVDNIIIVRGAPVAGFHINPSEPSWLEPDIHIINTASEDVILWEYDFADGGTSTIAEPDHHLEHPGTYEITQWVYNHFGCVDSAMVEITMTGGLIVHIPNSFTPDQDDVNDVFLPVVSGDEIENYDFVIWDRWGEIVFRTGIPGQAWTGNVHSGSYFGMDSVYEYQLTIKGKNIDEEVYRGTVTLIR